MRRPCAGTLWRYDTNFGRGCNVCGFSTGLFYGSGLGIFIIFVFEFDILTERGRLRCSDSGFARSAEAVVRDRLYRGFRNLGKPVRRTTELEDALPELYRHARAVLEGAERPRSSAQDALNTYEACMRIAKQ